MKIQLVLIWASIVLGFPSKQTVFSKQHAVLLENPELFKQFHELNQVSDDMEHVTEAWDMLLHNMSTDDLKSYFKKFFRDSKRKAAQTKFRSESVGSDFEILSHDDNYQLRIKKTHPEALGLDTVEQYAGYLDVRDVDKHFFYWFFESRNDPKHDPIILWLNGGPGSSSSLGLLFELGPSWINASLLPEFNPYSWNTNASVIFLDQPVGVGYSYAGLEDIDTSARAAKDVYIFLELFFRKFPQFLNNKFHLAGESYAGHYIPEIGSEIINHPERSFDVSSVLLGNSLIDFSMQRSYDQKMLCSEGGLDIFSPENCTQIEKYSSKCNFFTTLCYKHENLLTCVPSEYYCNLAYAPIAEKDLNPYDLRRKCGDIAGCYDDKQYIDDFLNETSTKEAVGVPQDLNFQSRNNNVHGYFGKTNDPSKRTQSKVAEMLDYGIPVLFYGGDKDFVCHWLGYNGVSNTIKFKGQEAYTQTEFKPWVVDNKHVGDVRGANGLTFLRVFDAGHMVPHDQPEIASVMLNTWLSSEYYFGY